MWIRIRWNSIEQKFSKIYVTVNLKKIYVSIYFRSDFQELRSYAIDCLLLVYLSSKLGSKCTICIASEFTDPRSCLLISNLEEDIGQSPLFTLSRFWWTQQTKCIFTTPTLQVQIPFTCYFVRMSSLENSSQVQ